MTVTLASNGGKESRKESMFLSTKVCFHQLELAVRQPSFSPVGACSGLRALLYVKEAVMRRDRQG